MSRNSSLLSRERIRNEEILVFGNQEEKQEIAQSLPRPTKGTEILWIELPRVVTGGRRPPAV